MHPTDLMNSCDDNGSNFTQAMLGIAGSSTGSRGVCFEGSSRSNALSEGSAEPTDRCEHSRRGYAFVQDADGTVNVIPDGPHVHPKILGGGSPAKYAGYMTIRRGRVVDLTNLSGTFQFDDEAGLPEVAAELRRQGLKFKAGAVRFFPADGSAPVILECSWR